MKKIFLITIVLFVGARVFSQQPYELGATKHDSIYYNETGLWITGVSSDGTLSDSSIQHLVTEAAVKRYADSVAAIGALDSIAAHTDTLQSHLDTLQSHNDRIKINAASIVSKQDSINAHTVIDQDHTSRLVVLEAIDHTHSNKDTLDGTTSKFTIALRASLVTAGTKNASQDDSIAYIGDTTRAHDVRLKALEAAGVSLVSITDVADSVVIASIFVANDSTYLFGRDIDLSDAWFTGTSTGATDTAHVENASWRGLVMDLKNPSEYLADQRIVDGHMELRIWYVNKAKELKYQYGWGGLGVMETQSAYAIFHEISMRWIVELEKKQIEQATQIQELKNNSKRSALKRKVNSLESRIKAIEKLVKL